MWQPERVTDRRFDAHLICLGAKPTAQSSVEGFIEFSECDSFVECGKLHCPECAVGPGESHAVRCSRIGLWTELQGIPVLLAIPEPDNGPVEAPLPQAPSRDEGRG